MYRKLARIAAGLAVNFGLSGCLFVLTFFFQQGRGYSALLTGLAFLPLTLPMMVNPMLTSRIPRLPLVNREESFDVENGKSRG